MAEKTHMALQGVSLGFGGLKVLTEISFEVPAAQLLALIGPNGAGKTSILNCISGIYHPAQGSIMYQGRDLVREKPHQVARLGVARSFQHAELFGHMSVLQNLLVGRHINLSCGTLADALFWGRARKQEVAQREAVERVIEFLELGRHRHTPAGSLPYGLQKIVGLGRALAMEPRVLLLDEPSAGMTRSEKIDLARLMMRIKHELGITMIWVEHDMQLVGDLADWSLVLNFGVVIARGKPETVLRDPQVVEAYLGH